MRPPTPAAPHYSTRLVLLAGLAAALAAAALAAVLLAPIPALAADAPPALPAAGGR